MKFNLKMIAIASAMASMAGASNAALTTGGNGSLALLAYNTVTKDYYIRDTGFLMNSFLPSSVTTLSGDGAVTGNKTPEAGLLLNAGNTTNFADASFATWLAQGAMADVRWSLSAIDSSGTNIASNVKRIITSSANLNETATNGQIDNFVNSSNAGGLAGLFGSATLSATGNAGDVPAFAENFGLGSDGMAAIGQSAGLFYFTRSFGTGTTGAAANGGAFGNTANFASVTLDAAGNLTYSLAAAEAPAAVPVPAAAWLLGSGLMALGGAARRRKAAAAV